ncbi:MAG: hypothetical protein KUG77_14770, partial [Nannocystaceae bacterium]|nr:hypothetical protein [Nannocystaceae bacterium]
TVARGPSALLLGVGAGLLCAAGAVGVVVALKNDKTPSGETELAVAERIDESASDHDELALDDSVLGEADERPADEASALEIGAEPESSAVPADPAPDAAPEALPEAPADPETEQPAAKTSRRGRSKGRKSGSNSGGSPPVAEPASKPKPPKLAPKMKVSLKLKKPLTVAYVKIDGASELVLEPMRRTQLTIGTHSIMWRPNRDQPYIQGGSITLKAGGKSTIRITQSGARLE